MKDRVDANPNQKNKIMCKFCWTVLILLLLLLGLGIYRFGVMGNTVPSEDHRVAIALSTTERDMVLAEMRDFLVSVQNILATSDQEDLSQAIAAAKRVGMAAQTSIPAGLLTKLPLEFKKLGFDTHRRFDQLALDAEQLGDPAHMREQLAELMQNCIACHATYRLVVQK